MTEINANGVRFHVAEGGQGSPLVLLHGFSGSSASWWPVVERLAEKHRVFAVDLLGHGQTEAPSGVDRYRFDLALDDLAAVVHALGIAPPAWLGYSMGGRLAVGMALRHADLVSFLILESATAGIADLVERATRRRSDEALARRIELDGIEAFVDEWEALPMWKSQCALPGEARQRQRAIRLANRPHGLASSLRGTGQGSQPSYWHRLGDVSAPIMLITGSLDEKFSGIAGRMAGAVAGSALAVVPGAGHAVHLEQPDAYSELVLGFLDRNGAQTAVSKDNVEEMRA